MKQDDFDAMLKRQMSLLTYPGKVDVTGRVMSAVNGGVLSPVLSPVRSRWMPVAAAASVALLLAVGAFFYRSLSVSEQNISRLMTDVYTYQTPYQQTTDFTTTFDVVESFIDSDY